MYSGCTGVSRNSPLIFMKDVTALLSHHYSCLTLYLELVMRKPNIVYARVIHPYNFISYRRTCILHRQDDISDIMLDKEQQRLDMHFLDPRKEVFFSTHVDPAPVSCWVSTQL